MDRLKQVPAWGWLALVGVAAVGFLVWHRYVGDQADENWHDPQQPDINIDVKMSQVPQPSQVRAKNREYPGSLAAWKECWVGDC